MIRNKSVFIGVIGGSKVSAQIEALAEEVGREIARRGAILVCGGLTGVMEAVCRGASAEGGLTVGILPGESREAANPYIKIPIITGLGYARNVAVVRTCHAVIAIDGSFGTLSEIGHALQADIPVVGLDTWNISIKGQADTSILNAENPQAAVEMAMALASARSSA